MTKVARVLAIVVGGTPRDLHGDRPQDRGQRSPSTGLSATLRMLRLARALSTTLSWRPVRRPAPLGMMVAVPALALAVAACSGASGAGAPSYSYATPASPAASAMTMGPSSSAPAGSAAPAASAAPSATASSATVSRPLHIAAQNIQFNTDHLEAPAGQVFVLEFDDNDPGIPHNIEIRDATGASMFKGQIITGPAKASYQVPALAAGSYVFLCDVHPTMTGTVTVK